MGEEVFVASNRILLLEKNKRMNVLVYTTLFPNNQHPNSGIFIKQRMFSFGRLNNCRVKVVAPVPYAPPLRVNQKWYQASQVQRKEVMDGIEVYHPRYALIPKFSMPFHGVSLFLSSMSLVKRLYRDFPFDLIDGHYIYPDGLAAVLFGKYFKVPVVLSARGSDINQFAGFRTIRPMICCALRQADHVISVCSALRQEMMNLGIDGEKISVIPNGVDTQRFHPLGRAASRNLLGIPEHEKVVLSVGALILRKGFHLILDCLPDLIRHHRDLHLYIIGEGEYRLQLEEKIRSLGLHSWVTLVGERPNDELSRWYSAADVFCLASSREGWANVIMESLACGTPVVATNVWGAPEILTSSDVGILVEHSSESIFHGLKMAMERTWDRAMIRAHVERRTWLKVGEEVRAIFEQVLRANPNAHGIHS